MDFSMGKDAMRDGWVTPQQAATLLHVPCEVVRTWMGRGWLEVLTDTTEDGPHEWISFGHALAIKHEQSMIHAPAPWHIDRLFS
jgi:hypothetical protein